MSYRRFAIILTAFICILQSVSTAAPRIDPQDLKNIMLLKDVRPGMKGYGLTVFRGVKPEQFEVQVLGVLKKFYFGSDLILVKLTGGPMSTRGANLIEGMSGSPVYVNGKLLGAFSMGYPFGKEPMGMVTPIEYMLDAWDPSLPTKPSSFYPMSTGSQEPVLLDAGEYGKVAIDYGQGVDAGSDTIVFRPLATPLFVCGMSPHIMSWMADDLKALNIQPVAGPGLATDKAHLSPDLQPGCAIGVSFVTGDLDMTGIGTLTYRRGDKLLGFGHPMMMTPMMNGLGPIQAALTTAYVYDVYPSLLISSKIAAPIKTVGTVFQDRPWSIGATIGKAPEMIPVTIHVDDQSLGRKKDFHVQVIRHPMLASSLVTAVTAEAIFEMRGSPGDATANVKLDITADEVGTITRENCYFDPVSIDMASVTELHQLLSMLQLNSFYPVAVKTVTVNVTILPKHQTAKLERIFLKESKFKPGDTIEIGTVLKPFKGDRITKTISLELPKNTPDGRMTLEVFGGSASRSSLSLMSSGQSGATILGGPPSSAPAPTMDNLKQVIKKFLERNKNDELVARVLLPQSVPVIAGEKFTAMPPTMLDAMKSTKATALGTEREEIKKANPQDWVILGSQRVSITVQREQKAEKKAAVKKPSDASSGPPAGPDSSSDESGMDEGDDSGDEGGILLDAFHSGLTTLADSDTSPAEEAPAAEDQPQPAEEDNAPADETTEVTAPAPPREVDEKPVGRVPQVWKQTTRTEFLTGTFKSTAATTGDLVALAGGLKPLYDSGETYVWQLLPDGKGNVYAGTGNHGIIYKIAPDGTATVVYDSPELEINSLAMDSSGVLYAGTSPNGIVYKIEGDKEAGALFDADEKYIVALALDSKGNLYAATGDKCKAYRISPDGKSEVVLDSSERHALSLAVDKDDNLYVGTAVSGIIYKIPFGGRPSVIYDAAEDSVTSLAVDSQGVLYAGTTPKGVIYKLAPDATPKVVYDKADKAVLGITCAENGGVFAVTPTNVYRCTSDDKVCTLENKRDLQFMSLAVKDGMLYAGTGNVGSVYSAEIGKATEGTYESPVHDCSLPSKWGQIEWSADIPQGASVTLQTRTGFVAEPDSTWSEWSAPYAASGAEVVNPTGRYIQYMATLKSADASSSLNLKDVSISYLPANQTPKVTLTSPKGGEKWAGKKTIRWTGTDPEKDNLNYQVFYSSDGGANWQQLKDKIKTAPQPPKEKPANDKQPKPKKEKAPKGEAMKISASDPEQMLAEMAAELDRHPEIPQDVKDKLLAEAPGMIADQQDRAAKQDAQSSEEAPPDQKPESNGTKQTSLTWDTAKNADGTYMVKVVGSDKAANPTDGLTGEAISEPIVICNKPPRVSAFKKTVTIQADRCVTLEGFALQEVTGIAGVQYRVGKGDWASAIPTDGLFDSSFESFTIKTEPLEKGEYTMEVKAISQAGRSATAKLPVKVE